LAEAELLLDAHRQFWDAVQAAQKTATVGEQLTISGQAVTVNKRGTTYLQVAEPSGESKVYYTKTSEITPEAAIALAERHFADSLPVAWRLAAAFLAVDRSGDVAAAGQYVARAEQHGVSSAFLIRSVRRLSGESPLEIDVATAAPPTATPPSDAVTTESSATAPAFVASGTEAASGRVTGETSSPPPSLETSSSLPSSEAQRDAQRTVLAPLLSDLKSRLPAERWPAEILKRAEDDSLDASARYVLLKSALQRAVAAQDLDVSLLAAERMHRSFGIDLTQLRHKTLQSLARRVPAAKRSHYAGIALEFARGAVVEDNYAAAVQFAVLAQSIGKSATDRFFRAHVNLVRQEFEQLQQGYESLDNIRQRVASGDPEATEAWGRFVLLQKGDFAKGLADFEMTSDPALSELVRLERLRPTVVDEQLALGSAWFNYAQILTSLEQRNAYRRAQWWLEAGLAAADRDQKLQTRQQLDQIDGLLGRSSETLDLTRLPVVSATVGFGSLGVNRNDDRTDRLVRPVPEIEGKPIEKYLWACAPSAIEYLIPGDAIRFSATGYVNAPTQDGVQFVVETEGREVFTSDVVKRMGVPVPIQVSLPKGTLWLRLKVVAGNTNTNDHAYWIAPQLEF
jgi:hypothetical protein